MGEVEEVSSNKSFGGWQKVYSHYSKELSCRMNFAIFLPPQTETDKAKGNLPCLYYLSGLTCTEQNFIGKAGSQAHAAQHGLVVVTPDTSPRGCQIEGEDETYDFGSGAGFYVDATEHKWKTNYRMYSYVTVELPGVICRNFPVDPDRRSIFGHSMGGHGALVCALKNPGMYRSVSAFAPICNPCQCQWGIQAFTGYLGTDQTTWEQYDACSLVKHYNGPRLEILIDQGKADKFLSEGQLLPENLTKASAGNSGVRLVLRNQEGYDHSYYFISTFISDHFSHHATMLKS